MGDDRKMITAKQQITDKYWTDAYKILDECMCKTQIEIDVMNKKKKNEGIGSKIAWLFALIFNGYVIIKKYSDQRQWNHWNKLCGIHITKDGVISDKPSSSVSQNSDGSTQGWLGILSSFFIGRNSIYQWIKVIIASAWSVLL